MHITSFIISIFPYFMPCVFCLYGIEKILDKNLNEPCSSDRDCAIAYSACQNKTCNCIDEFKAVGGLCKPPDLQCPTWKGQTLSKPVMLCESYYNEVNSIQEHTCEHGKEFCYVYPKVKSQSGRDVGHCCPLPPRKAQNFSLISPFLLLDNNATCPDLSDVPADAPTPADKIRTCPYDTHECIFTEFSKNGVCTPIPCTGSSSHFSVNGKCYDYVPIGLECDFDAVCSGGSQCVRQVGQFDGPIDYGYSLCTCPTSVCYEGSKHCCG